MAKLRPGRSGTDGVRRIVRAEAKKSIETLRAQWPPADQAIHGARKRIKKARAGLRLMRAAIGERTFRRENERFRDAARPLSEIRDARILIDALDKVIEDAAPRDRAALTRLRATLTARRLQARRRIVGNRTAPEPVIGAPRSARERVATPGGPHGWSALG